MQLKVYDDYYKYVRSQQKTVHRRGIACYFTDVEIQKICEWIKAKGIEPLKAVCHGARNGAEADEFVSNFPGLEAFGTDLFPYSGRSVKIKTNSKVIEHDFSKEVKEWKDSFDIVYTNSLDHARYPEKTLRVWLDQLTANGFLFVQWTSGHVIASGGDCFGATLYEYIQLINSVGTVVDLIYNKSPYMKHNNRRRRALESIVVVGCKDDKKS